jgi:predicted Ser/Thr protein kinase
MSEQGPSARDQLRDLGERIRERFSENRRVMSFSEYLEVVADNPTQQLRAAPQYTKDAFDYFGSKQVQYPWGEVRRFTLFDCAWADGRDKLFGHEEVQNRVYRALENFVHEGTSNKLVLLHGPNGSAKSTLVRCIGRGLQHYSTLDEGALYRFNWIFPAEKSSKTGIGFSGSALGAEASGDTFAYLPDELVDARLQDELRDHPMFLVPAAERTRMMRGWLETAPEFVLSDYLQFGRLSHRNRAIYEALLASYHGDYAKVLRHVQVERFFVRHRYREGYVTVEPQLAVDARERQVTVDRSVSALPAALQSVSLYEYGGELVNANRGLIEYSDLLKRPIEAYKYLLGTVERASVPLPNATLFLDLFFIGSSNEIHLSAFKEIAEFQSFRGRLELVRVPYLLDFRQEECIYEQRIREAAGTKHVAPHCAYVTGLWAVLTRMRKPQPDRYPKEVVDLVGRLTPLEKAELYALGRAPESLTPGQAKELLSHLAELWKESESYPNYEGRVGASPRELLVVIFNAANSDKYSYVSPLAILDEIGELIKQVSVYDFLKQEAMPGGYHAYDKFIDQIRERMIDLIDDEVRSSLGLVEEGEYERLFQRYVIHVMHWTKKEKVRNANTGNLENPDETLMREVERTLDVGNAIEDFRNGLIGKIGAWALDNVGEKPDYTRIFSGYFQKLRDSYFDERKKEVGREVMDLLALLAGDEKQLGDDERAKAEASLVRLEADYGYNADSARDLVGLLARERYRE